MMMMISLSCVSNDGPSPALAPALQVLSGEDPAWARREKRCPLSEPPTLLRYPTVDRGIQTRDEAPEGTLQTELKLEGPPPPPGHAAVYCRNMTSCVHPPRPLAGVALWSVLGVPPDHPPSLASTKCRRAHRVATSARPSKLAFGLPCAAHHDATPVTLRQGPVRGRYSRCPTWRDGLPCGRRRGVGWAWRRRLGAGWSAGLAGGGWARGALQEWRVSPAHVGHSFPAHIKAHLGAAVVNEPVLGPTVPLSPVISRD